MEKQREMTSVSCDSEEMRTASDAAPRRKKGRLAAEYVVKVAVMSAMLTALKFALSFVPNVEVVTLLVMVYAAVFGAAYVLPATFVFCTVEMAIYGVGSWVILYYLYWPLLALVSCAVFRHETTVAVRITVAAVTAVVMSAFFGVLSACCDTLFVAVGFPGLDLASYWVAYYVRGLPFDIVHMVSNLFVAGFLFVPLCKVADKIGRGSKRA